MKRLKLENSKKIIDTYLSTKKDLAEIIKFDPIVDNFWDHDSNLSGKIMKEINTNVF